MTKIRLLIVATAGILTTLAVTGAAEAYPYCLYGYQWWYDIFGNFHWICN